MANFSDVVVGDKVMVECYTGLGTGGVEAVTKIKKKYNENTGKPYKVICCGSHEFNAKNGDAITSPTMYYISHIVGRKQDRI